jgi:hypothetical protein
MWPPSERRIEAIRSAVAGPLDWPRFLRVARRHQVVGLVDEGLRYARSGVPPPIVGEIDTLAAALIRKNLAMAAEALRLQRLFNEANLPVVFVKGAALAMLAYNNLGMRAGQDIDVLVPYETLPAGMTLLSRAGYRCFDPLPSISGAQLRLVMPLRKDFGFAHESTGVRIELHWRLFLNPHAMAEDSIMEASRVVPLTGSEGLRTLGEEDLFAYLCMHGALHWWYRLKWLADINALLAGSSDDRMARLVQAAEVRGAGCAVAQALVLCRRLLGTPLPDRLMATLAKGATVRWLEATALRAMTAGQGELEPREKRFGTTLGSLSTFLLGRSWRYRLTELNLLLTNQTDVLTMPLPERLRFLYPILRLPLWVWRHTTKRHAGQEQ